MSLIANAFKELTSLKEDFLLEKDFTADETGFEALKDFEEDDAKSSDTVEVIDYNIDDDTVEDDEIDVNDYVGKVILDCNICHSKIYEDPAKVIVSEDGIANIDMECPYCSVTDGFAVVGEIVEFDKDADDTDDKDEDDIDDKEDDEDGTNVYYPIDIYGDLVANEDAWKFIKKQELPRVTFKSDESKFIKEGINNLSIETDDTKMDMVADENGKVTVTTEPITEVEETEDEDIEVSEISEETKDKILNNIDDVETEEIEETEEEIDEIKEESFNRLSESYLKKVYSNVDSFKLTEAFSKENRLFFEGVINFNSGKSKKTHFIFESHSTDGSAYKFIGSNNEITKGKKAFTLIGSLNEGVLTCNKMNYKYYGKALNESKVSKIYGTVKLTESK